MATATLTPAPAPAPRPLKRFTVEEYHRLIDLGFVTKRDRVELIRGLIVERPVMKPPHVIALTQLTILFYKLVGFERAIRSQAPITLADSEPQPGLVIAQGLLVDYVKGHPNPAQIQLVIEIADSTVREDQTSQLELYAESMVSEYWIVNIPELRIEVYTQPVRKSASYRMRKDYAIEDSVPVRLGGTDLGSLPVRDIFPR